eukprot:XP_011672855.1 PREDICTED: low-density lipoprotein receptor-related protein 6 [Strongylocentrotus purpuratus]
MRNNNRNNLWYRQGSKLFNACFGEEEVEEVEEIDGGGDGGLTAMNDPTMADSSSGITGISTTEAPTSTTISSTSVWTTMATFVGYSTPPMNETTTMYETTTPLNIFGEGMQMFVLDNVNRAIFYGGGDLQFSTLFTFPEHEDPTGVTIDTSGFRVFWTDLKTDLIHGASLYGTHPRIYSVGLYKEPVSISLVQSSGMVYCAYSKSNKITRLHLGYPSCETDLITNTPNPRAIAIDVSGWYLYWSRDGGIDRINLSSSRRQTIYQNPDFMNITGLAIDSLGPTTLVAFFDIDKHRTFYIDLSDPDNVVELTTSFPANDFLHVTQMSVYGGDMFWTKTGDSAGSYPEAAITLKL